MKLTIVIMLGLTCAGCGSRSQLEVPELVADASIAPVVDAGAPCEVIVEELPRPLDLLFVIDNSGSMRDEQQALAVELPRLIDILTTGDRDGDGVRDVLAVEDLHLGVVSTDMGLPGVLGREALQCGDERLRPLGDDGVLQHQPNVGMNPTLTCARSYPRFLAFDSMRDRPGEVANDFACIASLGTLGCGFEQQLEAALKALWPSNNRVAGRPVMLDRPFIAGSGQGAPDGANAGFLRNGSGDSASLVAVVLVTDEDDCSSWDLGHLVPREFLASNDPLVDVGLNLRCSTEANRGDASRLHRVERYVDGLRALRPNQPELVVFAAIVGAPSDLVSEDRLRNVNFDDADQRRLFYSDLLADSRMLETLDPDTAGGNANLFPSCRTERIDSITGELVQSKASPPRRIVQVVEGFGENGIVQSICTDTFRPAIDGIISRLGDTFERVRCVRR